jgi:hypothetical protein
VTIAIEVRNDEIVHGIRQPGPQGLPARKDYLTGRRGIANLPILVTDAKNVSPAIAVEVAQAKVLHAETGGLHFHERFCAAV